MMSSALSFYNTLSPDRKVAEFFNNFLTDPEFFFEDEFQKKDPSGVNMIEKPDKYIIQFPVPGYNRHTLKLEIQGNQLVVTADQKMQNGKLSDQSRQLYSFTLPQDVNANRIKAVCRNGLLEVSIKKHSINSKVKVIPFKDLNSSYIKKRLNWFNIRNKLKQILSFKKRSRVRFNKQSLFKSIRNQRLRLRRIPRELNGALKRMQMFIILILQALFLLLVSFIAAAFYVMHLFDQKALQL